MDGLRREHRLPHRGRAQLLQRPLSAGPPARRGPADRHDGRGLSQGPADRLPSPAPGAGPGLDPARAHAARPSRACGMDALAAHRVGGEDRAGHRAGRVRHPRQPAASGAGLSGLPGPAAAREALWRRAAGGGLCSGRPVGRAALPHGPEHPGHRARPAPAGRARGPRAGHPVHANLRGADYYAERRLPPRRRPRNPAKWPAAAYRSVWVTSSQRVLEALRPRPRGGTPETSALGRHTRPPDRPAAAAGIALAPRRRSGAFRHRRKETSCSSMRPSRR